MPPPRKPTPPPGAHPTYVPEEEDKTPVSGDPFVSLEHRSKRTHEDTKRALTELKYVAERVEDIDRKMDSYIERDQREHLELRMNDDKTSSAISELSDQVSVIDKNQAVGNSVLALIHEDVKTIKRIDEHKKKITIETAAVIERTQIEDAADSKKTRRARNLQILGIIGGVLGSGGIAVTIILALMGKC